MVDAAHALLLLLNALLNTAASVHGSMTLPPICN
jgi:hypothetical protein